MFSSSFKSASLFLFAALPAVLGATFDVSVGGLGTDVFKFTPDTVTAAQGDIVRFIFKQKNHTVTQVTFDNPCTQAPGGFDSGFIPVPQDQTDNFQTAEFRVEDATRPTWVMCRPHCRSQGMVFAINPGERMAAFKAAATGAAAPTGSTTGTAATPSSTAAAKDIKVIVGGTGVLAFNPSNVQANIGDRIIFEFHQKNHSVVASTFEQPCVPLSAAAGGWNSGYFPVSDTDTVFPTYSVVVNDTKPVWAYCSQGNHCGQGMVFSINAVEGSAKSFSAFQDLAKSINGTGAGTGGYGNSGAMSTTMNGAGVLLAALLAVVALL